MHWYFVSDGSIEKIKKQAAREDGQLLILPLESSKEAGDLSHPTSDSLSKNKGKQSSPQMQTTEQQEGSVATEPVRKTDRLISEDRYAELRERMKKKMSQLNAGIDPEMLSSCL